MSNLVDHAERELQLIGMTEDAHDEMNADMGKAIMDLVRLFASQGHSGSSAAYCLAVASKLLMYENLKEITSNPEDWIEVADDMWQCRRNPALFSSDGGVTHYHVDSHQVIHVSAKP